ncbi:TPA: hypothetical protein U2M54_002841 [Providencia rettgeri]|nr:hypothetical protein [Providencia rettgeri]HEM8177492.1 hypothetical protein [Providencia rettgeri]HEM8340712.1 hypothetical protein [Providencia rettgeri]
MSYKVLFLEDKLFYEGMLNHNFFHNCELFYNGGKLYNKNHQLIKYDLIVYTIYSSPLYNFIIRRASELNIKTLLLMDGICEFSNFTKNKKIMALGIDNYHPIIADNIGIIGKSAKKYFCSFGINALNYIPPRVIDMCIKNKNESNNKINKENVFLITTANTAYYDDSEYTKLINLLKDIILVLKNKNIRYYFRVFDEKIINELSIPHEKNLRNGSFEDTLEMVSFVITTPSSIILPAMYQRKPVAILQYRDSPNFIQSGWVISKDIDYSSTFASMMSFDKKRMNFQLNQIEDSLSKCDTVADCFKEKNSFTIKEVSQFINKTNINMLESKFNINFEYLARKIYIKYIKKSKFKNILARLIK